jgi:hypothetical protein
LAKTRADFLITVDGLSAKLNGIYSYIGKLDKNSNANIFSINLATETELAETKIMAGKLSAELKSKFHALSNFLKNNLFEFNFIYGV